MIPYSCQVAQVHLGFAAGDQPRSDSLGEGEGESELLERWPHLETSGLPFGTPDI